MSDQKMLSLAKIWESRIQQWQKTDKSLAAWSRENNFVYSQSIYWKSRFLGSESKTISTPTSSAFIELENESSCDSGIVIEIDTAQIHLSTKFDQEAFLKCVNLLKREVC